MWCEYTLCMRERQKKIFVKTAKSTIQLHNAFNNIAQNILKVSCFQTPRFNGDTMLIGRVTFFRALISMFV